MEGNNKYNLNIEIEYGKTSNKNKGRLPNATGMSVP